MGERKRKWRIRWYEHLGALLLGIAVSIIQFYLKPQELETREDVITQIVLATAKTIAIWIATVGYLWFMRFMHDKLSRLKPPPLPTYISASWKPVTVSMNRVHLFGSLALLTIAGISYGLFWWIWGKDAIRFPFAQFVQGVSRILLRTQNLFSRRQKYIKTKYNLLTHITPIEYHL